MRTLCEDGYSVRSSQMSGCRLITWQTIDYTLVCEPDNVQGPERLSLGSASTTTKKLLDFQDELKFHTAHVSISSGYESLGMNSHCLSFLMD